MKGDRFRPAVRAIVFDHADRVLLCRFDLVDQGVTVWAPPGGGVEHGETSLEALRRELDEEIGLALDSEPPLVWHQRVVAEGLAEGYDGVINDYFLIRTDRFEPRGSLSDVDLRAENITHIRWWTVEELQANPDEVLFGPRALPALLSALLTEGIPLTPLALGL